MPRTTTAIQAADGRCEASVFRPDGAGPWPAVLVFMDGIGIRPALFALCERIARHGYFVLLPDLFYRSGPYEAIEPARLFSDPAVRASWMGTHVLPLTLEKVRLDTRAFLAFLAAQPDVVPPGVGTTGYCMGGGFSLTAAWAYPERVVAAASYHGSRLVTDAPDSPHRHAAEMKARVYVGGADGDPGFTDAMKATLEQALTEAHVAHAIETYPARHGWVPTDTPVHDAAAAERHFETLLALFDQTLKSPT